jgi:hypothetical protein
MLTTAVTAAFGDLVDSGKSVDNLLGNDNNADEAMKLMWLADPVIKGVRLLWTDEVRTLSSRDETCMDGTLITIIVAGGDSLETQKNNQNTCSVNHEFTMFLNVNDIPSVRPATRKLFFCVRFPKQCVDE